MAKELFFPFNAVEDELGQPDRQYDATDFAKYFSRFIGNGVYPNPSNGLQVQSLYSNMVLVVADGSGYINGYGYVLDSEDEVLTVRVNDSHASYNRKDIIVLQSDLTERKINVVYRAGTASANPLPPVLVRNADIYELQLAEIFVKSGAQAIIQADITDTRLNTDLCGIVHGTVDQIDTTTLFNQYKSWYEYTTGKAVEDMQVFQNKFKADMLAWIESLKEVLDENTAANLLNLINELKSTTNTALSDKADKTQLGINATATHTNNVVSITAPPDAVQIIFEAPSNFRESDKYTLNGTPLTVTDLNNEPLNDAWKVGSPVPLTIKDGKAFFKGGGGSYGTLSPQIRNFTAKAGNHQIELHWTNPSDSNHAGTYLVRKQGSKPTKLSDGTKIDVGKARSYTDNEPNNDKQYYYRAFTYNAKKQVQTELTGAVVSAIPKAGTPLKDYPVGTLIRGKVNNCDINYIVVHIGKPSSSYHESCNGIWLLSDKLYIEKQWDNKKITSYDNSIVNNYLNTTYYNSLNQEFKQCIKDIVIPLGNLNTKIFLLSIREVGIYYGNGTGSKLDYFIKSTTYNDQTADNKRMAKSLNGKNINDWWTRDSKKEYNGGHSFTNVSCVNSYGCMKKMKTLREDVYYRPATIVNMNTLVKPNPNPDGSYNLMFE